MESRRSHVTAFARATVGRADRGKESNNYGKRMRTTGGDSRAKDEEEMERGVRERAGRYRPCVLGKWE